MFSILLFSTITTLILTTVQIYLDYKMGVESIEKTLAEIGSTQLTTLKENLWTLNQDQVKTQLQGLLEIQSITELSIYPQGIDPTQAASDNPDVFTITKLNKKNAIKNTAKLVEYYSLDYNRDNKNYPLGTLKVVGDKGPVIRALQSRILIILLSQGAKTFLVSFFIIFIFNHLVNRHIIKVSHFAKQVSIENMDVMLSLPRDGQKHPDELDELVESLNLMQIKITNEIAQRKHFERQLLQSQKMEALGTLASGIAHDFNNILQGLYNALFLIEEEVIDNADALGNLNLATKLTDRARELIKQILIFSRQEEGQFTTFSPTSAIQDVVEILRAARPKEISIDLLLDLPKTQIHGDQTQLKQIVLNLGNNAIGALEDVTKPQITISVSSENISVSDNIDLSSGNYLKIEVRDNGHGIESETLERIFEPFFTTKEVGKGTGLGLSVVHGIIQSHSGAVTVESVVGKGSTFSVFLPFVQTISLSDVVSYKGNERIFVVTSSDEVNAKLLQSLQGAGHKEVKCFTESQMALNQIKQDSALTKNREFIFIIDQEIQGFSSIELIRKLRQFYPKTPMVYLVNSSFHRSNLPSALNVHSIDRSSLPESELFTKVFQDACHTFKKPTAQNQL